MWNQDDLSPLPPFCHAARVWSLLDLHLAIYWHIAPGQGCNDFRVWAYPLLYPIVPLAGVRSGKALWCASGVVGQYRTHWLWRQPSPIPLEAAMLFPLYWLTNRDASPGTTPDGQSPVGQCHIPGDPIDQTTGLD